MPSFPQSALVPDVGSPEVHFNSERLRVGSWRNVFLILWRGKPQQEDVEVLRREYRAMALRSSEQFVAWVIIENMVSAPDDNVRRAITDSMDAVTDRIAASLAVLESQGFMAAATRAALSAMTLVLRRKYPTRFFATVPDAAKWSAEWTLDSTGHPLPVAAIVEQIARFRLQAS